jgi:hypothetical protein
VLSFALVAGLVLLLVLVATFFSSHRTSDPQTARCLRTTSRVEHGQPRLPTSPSPQAARQRYSLVGAVPSAQEEPPSVAALAVNPLEGLHGCGSLE